MPTHQRLSIQITGLVQGVGFRPFAYRLALRCGLTGWVANTAAGVQLEIQGEPGQLDDYLTRFHSECPPLAHIESLDIFPIPPEAETGFTLRTSQTTGDVSSFILPDLAPCPACQAEMLDPGNRRYRYPFISCTDCGPRWSLVTGLPFDRERTAMSGFLLCPACQAEYHDPADRRFHAQTQCCPACGPALGLHDRHGTRLAHAETALQHAVSLLRQGGILALKGVGGYQLAVDARDEAAVTRLRRLKSRPAKPLAILCASADAASQWATLSPEARAVLTSPAAPIVLLPKTPRADTHLAASLAPGLPLLGILLPASPLHHLLVLETGFPLVLTSGNPGGEPLLIDDDTARERLGHLADAFLSHNRPIQRPLDDSVVRLVAGEPLMLRRGRGYSPVIRLQQTWPERVALGGHLKNTVAISRGRQAILSQHLGDLDNLAAETHFQSTLADLKTLFKVADTAPHLCDLHPDYASSRLATEAGITPRRVQHHYAHVLSCLAEHHPAGQVLGVAFDGLGLGTDGTLWGGEFLMIHPAGFERVASLRPFRLPGGARAVREPRRVAYALLHQIMGDAVRSRTDWPPVAALSPVERATLARMLASGLNSPLCSSVGRWFDAVASLLGLCQINRFEGEAAMLLEYAATPHPDPEAYSFQLMDQPRGHPRHLIDWEPMLRDILDELPHQPASHLAARFQQTLVAMILAVAERTETKAIALSGGVFQNGWLTTRCLDCLRQNGYTVYRHSQIPPGDGGLAIGQLLAMEPGHANPPNHPHPTPL